MEKIICAAIWYKDLRPSSHFLPRNIAEGVVISGLRHAFCISVLVALTGKRSCKSEIGENVQGFITSEHRFLDRKEALNIAIAANQVNVAELGNPQVGLFSEDLY